MPTKGVWEVQDLKKEVPRLRTAKNKLGMDSNILENSMEWERCRDATPESGGALLNCIPTGGKSKGTLTLSAPVKELERLGGSKRETVENPQHCIQPGGGASNEGVGEYSISKPGLRKGKMGSESQSDQQQIAPRMSSWFPEKEDWKRLEGEAKTNLPLQYPRSLERGQSEVVQERDLQHEPRQLKLASQTVGTNHIKDESPGKVLQVRSPSSEGYYQQQKLMTPNRRYEEPTLDKRRNG